MVIYMTKKLTNEECCLIESCEQVVNTCISIKFLISESREYYELVQNMCNSILIIQKKLGSRILEIENKLNKFNEIMDKIKECSKENCESSKYNNPS